MLQTAEYLAALILAGILVWIACDEIARWWQERYMRRNREKYWREMQEKMEFWQQYDRKFSQEQRRIRGEE